MDPVGAIPPVVATLFFVPALVLSLGPRAAWLRVAGDRPLAARALLAAASMLWRGWRVMEKGAGA